MKRIKKIFAVALALAMVLGMCITSSAAGNSPKATDSTTATVENVEEKATVTAYRIVEPEYRESGDGFIGYKRAEGITDAMLKDLVEPTSDEITGIAQNKTLLDTLKSETFSAGTANAEGLATFTATLNPGYWVVVVTGSEMQEVYNPMLVGVYYSVSGSDDTLTSGAVNADSNWDLKSTPAYAKSTKPTLDKKIVGSTAANGTDNTDTTLAGTNGNGNDVAIGDTVKFEIDTMIPSYSKGYTDVIVNITDQLSEGLTLSDAAPVVTVGGGTAAAGTDYTFTKGSPENGFTIAFASEYALTHSGEAVVVTYSAVLNDKAGTNFDPNTNTAELIYTNDPQNVNHTQKIDDKTYTYTFEIDGNLFGGSKEKWNKVTEELLKGYKTKEEFESVEREIFAPLKDAKFTLTNTVTGKVYEATSDEKGMLNFKGLDAGSYELVEVEAPKGYSINDGAVPVVIDATYKEDGTLASYTITVDGKKTSTYSATYMNENITNITETYTKEGTEHPSDSYFFWNTKLASLPSTGGIGTTIFTIGGCAIMIIAAGLFFASRRKYTKQ